MGQAHATVGVGREAYRSASGREIGVRFAAALTVGPMPDAEVVLIVDVGRGPDPFCVLLRHFLEFLHSGALDGARPSFFAPSVG